MSKSMSVYDQLPIEVDLSQYRRRLEMYLEPSERCIEELAALEVDDWSEIVADADIAMEGLQLVSVWHSKLREIADLPYEKQVELLAYWDEIKNRHLDYLGVPPGFEE